MTMNGVTLREYDNAMGRPTMSRMNFETWMIAVDTALANLCGGLSSSDLPDCCYADWFEDGMSPKAAAKKAIRRAKGGE